MVNSVALFLFSANLNMLQVSLTKRERTKVKAADVEKEYWTDDWSEEKEILTLCRIPTMLKSKVLCMHRLELLIAPSMRFDWHSAGL
jgi:hypothetical protein